jgi:hypothetical protein
MRFIYRSKGMSKSLGWALSIEKYGICPAGNERVNSGQQSMIKIVLHAFWLCHWMIMIFNIQRSGISHMSLNENYRQTAPLFKERKTYRILKIPYFPLKIPYFPLKIPVSVDH